MLASLETILQRYSSQPWPGRSKPPLSLPGPSAFSFLLPALAKPPPCSAHRLSLPDSPPALAFSDGLDSAWLLFCFLSVLPILHISPQQRKGLELTQAVRIAPPPPRPPLCALSPQICIIKKLETQLANRAVSWGRGGGSEGDREPARSEFSFFGGALGTFTC